MKKAAYFIIFYLVALTVNAQPGKYAGAKKTLIGKNYLDSKKIPGLTGWRLIEGSMLSKVNDSELIIADVFKKGTTYLVLFSVKEDTAGIKFTIADILEVKNVSSQQEIRTGLCRENGNEDVGIVALIRKQLTGSSKAIRAWRFNRDKKRVELKSNKLVDCLNEGGD